MSTTIEEKIKDLEDEIRETPKNKSTERHIGFLKAKMAKLRRKQIDFQLSSRGSTGYGFDIKRTGDGTVVLLGFPSTGKSTLISKITSKESKIGAYDFTTTAAIPGILAHKGTQIQIIDLPGIIEGAHIGKGRGKEILAVARAADMILVLLESKPLDLKIIDCYDIIIEELGKVAIRPDKKKPFIKISKTERGGISISTLKALSHMSEKTFASIMREYKISNAQVTVRSDPTIDELIDILEGNRTYPKLLVVVNKTDLTSRKELKNLKKIFQDAIYISALSGKNLSTLKDVIVDKLELIQIYLKKQGEKTDYEEPLIITKYSTIKDVCAKIHRKFEKEFRYAVISGKSAKHPNQRVGLDHIIIEGDVITIITKKF